MEFSDSNCREFMEQQPEAVFVETLEGDILDVNKEVCELLGYSREELLEMEVDHLVPEDASAFLPDEIDNATRSGKPLETVNLQKDGTEVPIELRGRIIEVEGTKRMLVSVRDITERVKARNELKEANEKLKRSKERYQSYFEELGDAVFITKVGGEDHGQILDANKAAEHQSGYSHDELIGMRIHEDIAAEPPDSMEYETADKKLRKGETITFTEKKRRKDGGQYWTEVLITPIEYKGETASLSINRDVTERIRVKDRLEQFKMAIEGSDDLMNACDENYNYIFANPAYRSFYGVEEEEIRNYKLGNLISNDTFKSEVKPRMERCLQGERVEYEMERTHPDKGPRHLKITYYPLKSEEKIHGVVAVMRDVTERKEAEQKLRKSEERLELALEGTEAGIWDWKVQTGDVVFSERWAGIVGYTLEELQPATIETWKELAHPEDQKRSEELLEKHFNGETDFYECEARIKHKNGDWVWVLDRGKVVEWNEEGDPTRMVGTHQEITERKKAEQALSKERNKLKNLHDAVDELQRQDTEEDLLQTAVEVAENILDFEICAIDLLEGDYLVPKANSAGLDPDETTNFKIGEGIGGRTIQRGETIWGEDVRKHPDAKPTRSEWRAFISVPIGEIGILQVISKEVASFTKEDVELAEILAGHLQEEISRVRLEEDLRQQAIRDPLTDLYNRRYFSETLHKEAERCNRYDNSLAFLMLDVNRFKEINDRYSHQRGDEVLKEVADLLKENVRDADTVVRYGGDEFLIMMPVTNGEVENTATRLRQKLSGWNEESSLLDFPLTLAMGTSHWSPDQERDVEEALKEADRKMYEDKKRQ